MKNRTRLTSTTHRNRRPATTVAISTDFARRVLHALDDLLDEDEGRYSQEEIAGYAGELRHLLRKAGFALPCRCGEIVDLTSAEVR